MADQTDPNHPQTERAVDDIVARESDQLLADEDERLAEVARDADSQKPSKLRRFFRAWLGTAKGRWATFLFIVATSITIGAVPTSRYAVLNAAGVRAQLSVQVIDKSTLQPLADIHVEVAGKKVNTDEKGQAIFHELKLGPAELVISKPGFASSRRQLTVGWGSNPQGSIKLEPTGSQYAFRVTDYLSGEGIAAATGASGETTAQADDTGLIVLTLEKPADKFEVALTADGYRTEELTINAGDVDERVVRLVPARKHAFLSNRKGTLDLYKIDIDGKNEQLVLAGTGGERDDTVLIPHPTASIVALISRRSPSRASDGRALPVLTIIDLSTNKSEELLTSDHIQPLSWSGNHLAFVHNVPGLAAEDPTRQKLASYDFKAKNTKELAKANSFNTALLAAGYVYYAPAAAYQNGINVSLFRVAPDGSSSSVLLSKEVHSIVRTAYSNLSLTTPDGWYDYQLGGGQPTSGVAPASSVSRRYIDNGSTTYSLWSERQSNQDTLLLYDAKTAQDRARRSQIGLGYPISWLTDTAAVYRVRTGQMTADYAISVIGGEPQKITNVTNVGPSQ